ncbi:MAG: alanine--glyoxylate aminotransferase family protein [Sphaerobacteraceae bacterium]|nr:MAG: alanine--glyoxylate aminotransferase family protein [Sphaerobacteraceae bacterium]
MNEQNLRIPGPTPVPPEVVKAMQRPMYSHRSEAFRTLHRDLNSKLQTILRTSQDVYVMPGSGSIGWEAAIVNTLSPGDSVLAVVTGDFGVRFANVAERFGLEVSRLEIEPGQAATADQVRSVLETNPAFKAVLFTHNETSTGITNPLEEVGPVVRDHGALLLVDAVSSAGAIPIETDAWGADVLLTGSQKGWMCPPGLAIVVAGERALAAGEQATFPRAFLDFADWHKSASNGDTPSTAPLSLYSGLNAACDLILEEGLQARGYRHDEAAERTRTAFEQAGLELFADPAYASSTLTSIRMPGGQGAKDLVKSVRERYHIEVAAGQADLSDKIIRVGHMGWFEQEDIARAVDAVVACATVLAE